MSENQTRSMYEYTVVISDVPIAADWLNDLAQHAWRFVAIVHHEGRFFCYLERERSPSIWAEVNIRAAVEPTAAERDEAQAAAQQVALKMLAEADARHNAAYSELYKRTLEAEQKWWSKTRPATPEERAAAKRDKLREAEEER